jgi:hypothetical protein
MQKCHTHCLPVCFLWKIFDFDLPVLLIYLKNLVPGDSVKPGRL